MDRFKYIFVFIAFLTIAFGAVCPAIESKSSHQDAIESEIQSTLDRVDMSMKAKDLGAIGSAFAQSHGLLSIGLDSQAFGWDSLKKALKQQMDIVNDYRSTLIDRKIIVDPNGKRARYFQRYSLTFKVQPFTFHVPEIRETGIVEKFDGSWVIIQQHSSVPVTNDLWPAYMTTDGDGSSTYDIQRQISADKLAEDFDLLVLALEEAHAGLYRYMDRETFQKQVRTIQNQIARPMTDVEFYRLICPIVANIKCGHTSFSPCGNYWKHVKENGCFFPLQLKFLAGKAYVVGNCSSNKTPLRSQIVSINGRLMNDIVKSMMSFLCTDGDILSAKYRILDDSFAEKYHLFIDQPDTFEVEYLTGHDRQKHTLVLKGVPYREMKENRRKLRSTPPSILNLHIKDHPKVAVLTIKKFVNDEIENVHGSFRKYMDKTFTEIKEKNIQNLIIDLRGNGGGDVAHKLIDYVVDKPIPYYRSIDTRKIRYSFLEYTDNGVFFNRVHPHLWNKTRNHENRYELKGDYDHTSEPSPLQFQGHLYILIDGHSFSASAEFASVVHYHRRAIFIGEETGGAYYGNNAGDFLKLTLPHTKLRVNIPIRRYVMAVGDYPYKTRGIIPDYEIEPAIDDVLSDRDKIMEFTMNHIRKKNIEDSSDQKLKR